MTIRATVRQNTVLLSADNESRSELADAFRSGGYPRAEQYVGEALHERWEFVRPEEVGALTDAPILAECDGIVRNDNGDLTEVGKVCWYPNYQVFDPWAILRNTGRVELQLAPKD
jgi:hypothetical protein